jgi:7-cyano-7-deazaguanine synthase in queuosine biosynthesis
MNDAAEFFPIHVLWTGGLDSSYRMVQLSRRMVQIQPYYLRDNRRSERLELSSIAEITKEIQEHPDTRCTVLPLVTCRVSEIAPDKEITRAYRSLRRTTNIGSQYDWLARFAKTIDGLELCIHDADKALKCIVKWGALKPQQDIANAPYHVIDAHRSSTNLFRVFGRFRFPIIEKTKLEMIEDFKRWGFEQTMHKTWFCFTPIDGKPCGLCNPCKSAIEEGLSFRFTEAALLRYENRLQASVAQRTLRAVLSRLHILDLAEDIWKMQARRRRRSS